jgi:hypothetical protein
MRTIFFLTIVLSAAVGLVTSDGAEPARPPAIPNAVPPPYVVPSPVSELPPGSKPAIPPSPYQAPFYGPPQPQAPEFGHNDITWLRQEFVAMAKKRAERMDGPELKQAIADMRRQWLIAELTSFGAESSDVRVAVAAMALKAKDQKELEKLIRSFVAEMEEEKSGSE